jgi:23S rRNA pseudouridine2605 synthase
MQRVQKFLAQVGVASRRQVEAWIKQHRLQIDGKVAELGAMVSGREQFKLDNKVIVLPELLTDQEETKVILYHKPVGKICTKSDPEGRPTVFADLPKLKSGRWIMVGRLDLNTSGLLLFTNNGDLANQLMHPSYNQEREYMVRVLGKLDRNTINILTTGVKFPDGLLKFKKITLVKQTDNLGVNHWYKVILTEGKNREIKRLFESQGLMVNRLIRIRFGNIHLPKDLPLGKFRLVQANKLLKKS